MLKYIAKEHPEPNDGPGEVWYDAGTEVELIDDYRLEDTPMDCGLFRGLRDGKTDEEVCSFDEFIVEEA